RVVGLGVAHELMGDVLRGDAPPVPGELVRADRVEVLDPLLERGLARGAGELLAAPGRRAVVDRHERVARREEFMLRARAVRGAGHARVHAAELVVARAPLALALE